MNAFDRWGAGIVLLSCGLAGCSGKDGAGAAGSASAKGATLPLVEYKHTNPDFTIKVPKSCKAQPEAPDASGVTLRCADNATTEIDLSWLPKDVGRGAPKLDDGYIEVAKGDMAQGKGKWLRYKDATDNHGMEAIVAVGETEFRCWVWLMSDDAQLLDSCKSLSVSAK